MAASSRLNCWGASIPEESIWGRWAFPLPNPEEGGKARGIHLAWTALQLKWTKEAEEQRITQITRPERVHSFINGQPGLREACLDCPLWLASYAPQLTIPGFGGEFEQSFDDLLGRNPGAEEVALRTPRIDLLDAATVTCHYVQGTMFGPSPRFYSHMEYLVWFLSKDSQWLPVSVRELLQRGMQEWDVWTNDDTYNLGERPFFDNYGMRVSMVGPSNSLRKLEKILLPYSVIALRLLSSLMTHVRSWNNSLPSVI